MRFFVIPPARRTMSVVLFITLLSFMQSAAAQTPAPATQPQALSPAVQLVLDRARQGIDRAQHSGAVAKLILTAIPDWLREEVSSVFLPIDTAQQTIVQGRSVLADTACFRADQWAMEQTMDGVRAQIDAAEQTGDVYVIFHLEDVYTFLSKELASLTQTGLTPVEDDTWPQLLLSEPDDPSRPATLSFYDSDYAPPSAAGYGCDAEMLEKVLAMLPADSPLAASTQEELHAMTLAEQTITQNGQAQETFTQLQSGLDAFFSGDSSSAASSSSAPARVHKTQSGLVDAIADGVILRPLRGPFSLVPDPNLIFTFRDLRSTEEIARPLPAGLENVAGGDALENLSRQELRGLLQSFTAAQTDLETATFAAAADPGLSLVEDFSQLRSAVGALVTLGNSLDGGLRGFVRDFAYFLLRSCGQRPCTNKLTNILQLDFTDACFAYGNGDYLNDTPANPRWQKCLQGAGLL